MWNTLNPFISQDIVFAARGLTLTDDELGAVFDMPSDKMAAVRSCWGLSRQGPGIVGLWRDAASDAIRRRSTE